jgi:hypothetical protein
MIFFSKIFPKWKYPLGYLKLLKAHFNYFDHLKIDIKNPKKFGFINIGGYQGDLSKLRDKHKGKRGFIIANGPSLKDIDMSLLKDEITIGCNGIFNVFEELGFHTNYYMTEDQEQTELRGKEISKLKGPIKLAALHNAHAFSMFTDIIFFHVPRRRESEYYTKNDLYAQFSKDFASIAHLGSTVTYLMIQLAYHLGLEEVYLVGLDHNYGKLVEIFPPGKIEITEDNYPMVQECHYDKKYYKVGDLIGIPWVKGQEKAYISARKAFEEEGRKIYNASTFSQLKVFERVKFDDIFNL